MFVPSGWSSPGRPGNNGAIWQSYCHKEFQFAERNTDSNKIEGVWHPKHIAHPPYSIGHSSDLARNLGVGVFEVGKSDSPPLALTLSTAI
jgi:hypothetical protein